MNFGNSENDSDAESVGGVPNRFVDKVSLQYLTGRDGENDFSLDFGLVGCDLSSPDTLVLEICKGDSIQLGSHWFSEANPTGMVHFPNPSGFGCDSLIWVHSQIKNLSSSMLDTSLCSGRKLVLHGETFDEARPSGAILLDGANHRGCDSVLMVSLRFNPHTDYDLDTSFCPGGRIVIHNETFDASRTTGLIRLMGANQFGCDSFIRVNVNILAESASSLDTVVCSSGKIVIHNEVFDAGKTAGRVLLSAANQYGCDSVINVHLKILAESSSALAISICPGEHVSLHGQRFDSLNPDGRILLPGLNQFGCDSAIQVSISFYGLSYSSLDTAICPGGSVSLHSKHFDAENRTGDIVLPRSNQFGCDSVIKVNLRVFDQYDILDTLEACREYTWPVNGVTYRNSGHFRLDATSRDGCDSVHQLFLTILPEYRFYDTICALDKYHWHADGLSYRESGEYEHNHYTRKGCDSIEYLYLIIVHGGEVYVPNAFTPNGDQVNDRLTVYANEDVQMIDHFAIYDRWGELVFQQRNFLPNDPSVGWDGAFRETPVRPAVFAYLVQWRDKFGNMHKAYGDVTLVR